MALANAQGHISLNGKSYVLIEESYEKRAQQPFSPRFATGDPSTGDLSFWQFLTQRGFTSEGQDLFSTVSSYKQSAGWDMRDGKARLGYGTESVTLTTALPAFSTTTSVLLLDDFEASGSYTTNWPTYNTGGGLSQYTLGGQNCIGPNGHAIALHAREGSGGSFPGYITRWSSDFAVSGEWRVDMWMAATASTTPHGAFMFISNATDGTSVSAATDTDWDGYVLEVSGANMVTWKLIKTTCHPSRNATDTVLATFVATAKSATWTTLKITRSSAGLFEIFQDGVSLGTHTDTTYNTGGCIALSNRVSGSGAAAFYWDNLYVPGATATTSGLTGKAINYYNSIYTCWDSGAAAFTFTTSRTAAAASNLPKIVHVNANDICVWNRDGSPTGSVNTYLAACYGTTLRCYNNETQVFTVGTTISGTGVIPLSSTRLIVVGTTSANSGVPAIEIVTFSAEAWTVASQVVLQLDGGVSGRVSSYAALDANGALWFAFSDMSLATGTQPSRVFYVTAADLVASAPTVTTAYTLTDFIVRGVFSLQGTVYLFGSRRRGDNVHSAIMKTNGDFVYESTLEVSLSDIGTAANFFNHGIPCVWKNMDHALFLGSTDLDQWDPIIQLDASGNMVEVASFDAEQFDYALPTPIAIAEWNGRFYMVNAQAGTVKRTAGTRGALVGDPTTCVLELSQMGANTDLINKTLYSVTMELSAAVPASETLTVAVNGTTVGTMVAADGTRKEIVLTSELTSSKFIVKLSWPKASTWTGYIKDGPILRYIPTQFKKRAWGFGIRATKRLKMGDGSHNALTPTTMFSNIEAAWASNTPVTFIDVDATSYTVIVTDFKQKRPLLDISRSSSQEAFYFVEILEV